MFLKAARVGLHRVSAGGPRFPAAFRTPEPGRTDTSTWRRQRLPPVTKGRRRKGDARPGEAPGRLQAGPVPTAEPRLSGSSRRQPHECRASPRAPGPGPRRCSQDAARRREEPVPAQPAAGGRAPPPGTSRGRERPAEPPPGPAHLHQLAAAGHEADPQLLLAAHHGGARRGPGPGLLLPPPRSTPRGAAPRMRRPAPIGPKGAGGGGGAAGRAWGGPAALPAEG